MKLSEPTTKSRYTIEALARGLEVLGLFTAERPALPLSEIVEALGLSKSTAFRILATLEQLGFLEHDPATRRYRPGLKVFQLGFAALAGLDIQQIARPHLERLALELDETASMAVLEGADIVYVERIRNRAIVGVMLGVGSHLPAHSASLGKVLLADLPVPELTERLSRANLARMTDHTIVDRAALLAELAEIRRRGYAISDQELAVGLRAVAAPVRDRSGRAVAAISISGPTATISSARLEQAIAPAVVAAAQRISQALGFTALQQGRSDDPTRLPPAPTRGGGK
jgi:IclR family pca regulon transcriptional regulator